MTSRETPINDDELLMIIRGIALDEYGNNRTLYAKDLGVTPAMVSSVLKGEKKPSDKFKEPLKIKNEMVAPNSLVERYVYNRRRK